MKFFKQNKLSQATKDFSLRFRFTPRSFKLLQLEKIVILTSYHEETDINQTENNHNVNRAFSHTHFGKSVQFSLIIAAKALLFRFRGCSHEQKK